MGTDDNSRLDIYWTHLNNASPSVRNIYNLVYKIWEYVSLQYQTATITFIRFFPELSDNRMFCLTK